MKSQKAVSLFFSITVIGAYAVTTPAAWAAQGALIFHGSVTNATCDAQVYSAPSSTGSFKTLRADTYLTVGDSGGDDTCAQRVGPVQVTFNELSAAGPDIHAGIVTLTYQ